MWHMLRFLWGIGGWGGGGGVIGKKTFSIVGKCMTIKIWVQKNHFSNDLILNVGQMIFLLYIIIFNNYYFA